MLAWFLYVSEFIVYFPPNGHISNQKPPPMFGECAFHFMSVWGTCNMAHVHGDGATRNHVTNMLVVQSARMTHAVFTLQFHVFIFFLRAPFFGLVLISSDITRNYPETSN